MLKKDNELCFCVDYRKLNEIMIKNRDLLFDIKEYQDRLQDAKWFIRLNSQKTYNVIKMKTEKEWKTTFRIKYDLYKYLITSFELINVSITCQELINNILQKHLDIFVIVYLNDIFIYFKTEEKHIKHVNIVLELLIEKNLLFKSVKPVHGRYRFISWLGMD